MIVLSMQVHLSGAVGALRQAIGGGRTCTVQWCWPCVYWSASLEAQCLPARLSSSSWCVLNCVPMWSQEFFFIQTVTVLLFIHFVVYTLHLLFIHILLCTIPKNKYSFKINIQVDSLELFKSNLKTHLFKAAFVNYL